MNRYTYAIENTAAKTQQTIKMGHGLTIESVFANLKSGERLLRLKTLTKTGNPITKPRKWALLDNKRNWQPLA